MMLYMQITTLGPVLVFDEMEMMLTPQLCYTMYLREIISQMKKLLIGILFKVSDNECTYSKSYFQLITYYSIYISEVQVNI